jgi:hypothetical protein
MDIELEKRLIIDEISHLQDEWIVKAIKKLLDLDYDIEVSVEHQQILNERIASYEVNPSQALEWDKVKNELLNK